MREVKVNDAIDLENRSECRNKNREKVYKFSVRCCCVRNEIISKLFAIVCEYNIIEKNT